MNKRKIILLPNVQKILTVLGENIKLARLRRKLSAMQVAERANISRQTLMAIEKGTSGVSIGAYIQVLFVLRLEKDLLQVAGDDLLGRKMQDANLITGLRAPKNPKK